MTGREDEEAVGLSTLLKHIDASAGDDDAYLLLHWRRAVLELDQMRSLGMLKLNSELKGNHDKGRAFKVRGRFKYSMMRLNRDIDHHVTRRLLICGQDSMDQIVIDSSIRRLHYQIELIRITLDLLGTDGESAIAVTDAARALLFLVKRHVKLNAALTLPQTTTKAKIKAAARAHTRKKRPRPTVAQASASKRLKPLVHFSD